MCFKIFEIIGKNVFGILLIKLGLCKGVWVWIGRLSVFLKLVFFKIVWDKYLIYVYFL